MSQIETGWGAGPGGGYEQLAARFRPLFARLREGALERELTRRLPAAEIKTLAQSGFSALRVPSEQGGGAVSLEVLFALLIELAEADSNLVQSLRGHLGFTEDVLNRHGWRERQGWLARIAQGELIGPASSEAGNAVRRAEFSTRLIRDGEGWRLEGEKFYTTGSLYSDWIAVRATGPEGESFSVVVPRGADGVSVIDDWSGFGQTLTASGSARFDRVRVAAWQVADGDQRFDYSQAFYQLVHLATLAGIGRAMADEVAAAVAARERTYSNGNASRVRQDPQVLQVVGKLRSAAYAAGAIVLKNAEALDRVDRLPIEEVERRRHAVELADLETAQGQSVVSALILDASSQLFDALGASATLRESGLDRFWRNARTLISHNPRIYRERIVGDFAVNGTPPPGQWRIGVE